MKELFIRTEATTTTVESYFESLLESVKLAISEETFEAETAEELHTAIMKFAEAWLYEDSAIIVDENNNEVSFEELDSSETEFGFKAAGDYMTVYSEKEAEYKQAVNQFINSITFEISIKGNWLGSEDSEAEAEEDHEIIITGISLNDFSETVRSFSEEFEEVEEVTAVPAV